MSRPQPLPDTAELPLRPQPAPAVTQPPRPPKTADKTAEMAATLAWLETNITAIYLAGRTTPFQEGPHKVAFKLYLDIHRVTLDYCDGTKQSRRSGATYNLNSPLRNHPERWATADLYTSLRDTIRTHCIAIRTRLFAPENSAGVDGARRLIGEYVAHWNMMVHLSTYVPNLLRHLEMMWIKRCMDEGLPDIHMIKDLHSMIWKEEVLHVGVPGAEEVTRNEMDPAVELLQNQGECGIGGDKELVEKFLEPLRAVGLASVFAIR